MEAVISLHLFDVLIGKFKYDQMTQASRSVPANIAEGNSRHSTSKETEMRLTDVARAAMRWQDYIDTTH